MKNRYGDEYDFVQVDEDTYTIVGNLKYWRYGSLEGQHVVDYNNLGMVDPSGGPYIELGMKIQGRPIVRISLKEDAIMLHMGEADKTRSKT